MIEKMKVVHIVAAQTQKTELLDALRALGIVHFAEKADADQTYLERFAALSRLITVLEEQGVSEVEAETLDDVKFKQLYDGLNACLERKKALETERAAAVSACDTLAGWGSFSPAEIKELKAQGFELHFCRVDKKLLASLEADKEVRFLRLAPVGKQQTVAILGALPASCAAGEFIPPEKSLDEYRQEIADCERGLSECGAQLKAAAKHLPSFREQLLKTQNDADYSSVRNTSESGDGLVWLTGYLPVDEAERFKAAAAKEHWAWAMDDPAADDDKVPTKIKYTKVTRLIAPVFDILGTVPGYREYDISFWFLGFFTLFFAMIIGDAGYGCLFLLTAAALTVKSKKPSDAVQLLWVLSIATIVWGAMTGTWFGLEGAMDVPLLRSLVVPSFANYPEFQRHHHPAAEQRHEILLHPRHRPALAGVCDEHPPQDAGEGPQLGRRPRLAVRDLRAVLRGALPRHRRAGEPHAHCRGGPSRLCAGRVLRRYVAGQDLRAGSQGGPWQRLHSVPQHHQRLRQHHELHPTVCRRHGVARYRAEL